MRWPATNVANMIASIHPKTVSCYIKVMVYGRVVKTHRASFRNGLPTEILLKLCVESQGDGWPLLPRYHGSTAALKTLYLYSWNKFEITIHPSQSVESVWGRSQIIRDLLQLFIKKITHLEWSPGLRLGIDNSSTCRNSKLQKQERNWVSDTVF